MSEIIVRKARREDCKAIMTLIQELADYQKISHGPQIDYKSLERDGFDGQPLFLCNVATSNEKVIGYAIFYYTYSTWTGKVMYLEDLYVTQEFRGQHVGSKLLKSVAKEAAENNCDKLDFVVLNWNPAQTFYKTHGALDLTSIEKWHYYRIPKTEIAKLAAEWADQERIRSVGPDRVCAEWLLRNGASVRWKGFSKYLSDYNSLPSDKTQYYIQAVDATDSAITHVGFPHFVGCRYIDEIKLIRCFYLYDGALPLLSAVKDTLTTLEIIDCESITDNGIQSLKKLTNLKTLKLSGMPYVKDKNLLRKELAEALPDCTIVFN